LKVLRIARLFVPNHLFIAQLVGLFTARTANWVSAGSILRDIVSKKDQRYALQDTRASLLLAPLDPSPALNLAIPVSERPPLLSKESTKHFVVYTTSFGVRSNLPPLFGQPEGLRFICFTDQPIVGFGWEIVPTKLSEYASDFHLICPHRVLYEVAPEAEASLYLDRDMLVIGNMHTLLLRWFMPQRFALWRHPHCIDWHHLIERHLVVGSAPLDSILHEAEACENSQIPRSHGAWSTAVIWRRHAQRAVRETMDTWWELHQETHGPCDVTLYRLLHGSISPKVIPETVPAVVGSAEDNIFFARPVQHSFSRNAGKAHKSRLRRVPITFLCPEDRQARVTAILRAEQLSEIISARFLDIYDVSYTSDILAAKNGIVVLTPYALNRYDVETISEIKARNIALIGSWEDGKPKAEKVRLLDAHMTLSLRQQLDLGRVYPEVPAFHVTHHVNLKVPQTIPPMDKLRTAYFGDPLNTVYPDSLSGHIKVFDTLVSSGNWLDELPGFNCHWIVRQRRPGFGWKPFLKGFLAARCGAVVIVTRDDPNAGHYLGDDYPFYADSLDPVDLEMVWVYVSSAFGSHEWNLAREIMQQVAARSTDFQVASEFKAMVDDVLS
ncbi:MAG: hypothetical protein KFF50_07660, partial [Desulfatitalea sp.]|nr:hypothetical protein [Desulfatitalea sp.]